MNTEVEVGTKWLRKRRVRGERRVAIVVTVGAWGKDIIEYRYTRPLRDGYGKGNGKLGPRVNTTVRSAASFLRDFAPCTLQRMLTADEPPPPHGFRL